MIVLISALSLAIGMAISDTIPSALQSLFHMAFPTLPFFLFAWVRPGLLVGSEKVGADGDEKRLKKDLAWLEKQLWRLKDTFDEEELTQEEYDEERKALLAKL